MVTQKNRKSKTTVKLDHDMEITADLDTLSWLQFVTLIAAYHFKDSELPTLYEKAFEASEKMRERLQKRGYYDDIEVREKKEKSLFNDIKMREEKEDELF